MGRKLRTASDLLRPDLRTTVLQKQLAQKRDYDQRAKPRAQAQPGHRVFARNFRPGLSWMPTGQSPGNTIPRRSCSGMTGDNGPTTWIM
ncbi:hypothetical protein HPB48_022771 [Haemaphysalis longicornis]|uniref:Uncharacterized protein n=1 Tax=Haemaphysalis longicornis TaxID=44386 RepID=A0A9J6FP83_HAELO|nr:hypothetical protein HPB48_022771 [Haemaphysalis longicornis]